MQKTMKFILVIVLCFLIFSSTMVFADSQYTTGCLPENNINLDKNENIVLPKLNIDMRSNMPPVWKQNRGSCTAQAVAASIAYQFRIRRSEYFEPSRNFIYFMTRLDRGDIYNDTGAQLSETCRTVVKYGVCWEKAYPEDLPLATYPSFNALYTAIRYRANAYYRLNTFDDIIQALKNGIPVVFATDIYRWEVGSDGIVRNALNWTTGSNTGHAMVIAGYLYNFDIDGENVPVFVVRNSWGVDWGNKGYAYVPAEALYRYNMSVAYAVYVDSIPPYFAAEERIKSFCISAQATNPLAIKTLRFDGSIRYVHRDYLLDFYKMGYTYIP